MPGWIEVALRSFFGLVVIIFLAKLFVRRPIGHLNYFEFIALTAVAIIVGVGSVMLSIPVGYVITALLVWTFIPFFIGFLSMKSHRFRNLIGGRGIPFIKDGKIMEDNLKKTRYSSEELMAQLRAKQAFRVADVEFAVLEPSGDINILMKKDYQPLTPKDMKLPIAPIKQPETVIMDGKILDESLATLGFNRQWLETELDKTGAAIENVYLGQVDSFGQLTLDLFDDLIEVPQPVEKPMLLSTIKKCQADLEGFALATENKQAKQMYEQDAKELQRVIDKLTPFLQ